MNLRYPHISSGYIAQKHTQQTLNAEYYGMIDHISSEHIMLFPQRIPKIGFFEELLGLECSYFKMKLNNTRQRLVNTLNKLSYECIANTKKLREYINYANLCLRHGCFIAIIQSMKNIEHWKHDCIELVLLDQIAQCEYQLSHGQPIKLSHYLDLTDHLMYANISEREKMMLFNHLIVTYYRHCQDPLLQKVMFNYANDYLELLEKLETDDLLSQLYCSVGYRGIAMCSDFGNKMQSNFLDRAENLALNLQAHSSLEDLIKKENLSIICQTMSKWHQQHNDYKRSETYLNQMIAYDPHDSTGHSELGFHYIKTEQYDEASVYFKKAMELGPPGTGMNAYYYAKCLETLGKEDDAINYLYEATALDEQGLSPWLDLFDYYNHRDDKDNAMDIAKHILTNPSLAEQLDPDETIKLQQFAN